MATLLEAVLEGLCGCDGGHTTAGCALNTPCVIAGDFFNLRTIS